MEQQPSNTYAKNHSGKKRQQQYFSPFAESQYIISNQGHEQKKRIFRESREVLATNNMLMNQHADDQPDPTGSTFNSACFPMLDLKSESSHFKQNLSPPICNNQEHSRSSNESRESQSNSPGNKNMGNSLDPWPQKYPPQLYQPQQQLSHSIGQPSMARQYGHMPHSLSSTKNEESLNNDRLSNSDEQDSNSLIKRTRKPIIIMKIDIGAGRSDEISLFEGDDPARVAGAFCYKNHLDARVIEPLTRNIVAQLNVYLKHKEERKRQRSLSKNTTRTEINPNDSLCNQETSRTIEETDSNRKAESLKRPLTENNSSTGSDTIFELHTEKQSEDAGPKAEEPHFSENPRSERQLSYDRGQSNDRRNIEFKFVEPPKQLEQEETASQVFTKSAAVFDHSREIQEEQPVFSRPDSRVQVTEQRIFQEKRRSSPSPGPIKTQPPMMKKVRSLSTKSVRESISQRKLSRTMRDIDDDDDITQYYEDNDEGFEKNHTKALFSNAKDQAFNRLYQEAQNRKNRMDNLKSAVYKERNEREINQYTFHPTINKTRTVTPKAAGEYTTAKSKIQLDFSACKLTTPKHTSKGSISVRNQSNACPNSNQSSQAKPAVYSKLQAQKRQEKQPLEKQKIPSIKIPLQMNRLESNTKGKISLGDHTRKHTPVAVDRNPKIARTETGKLRNNPSLTNVAHTAEQKLQKAPSIGKINRADAQEKLAVYQVDKPNKEGPVKKRSLRESILQRTRSEKVIKQVEPQSREERVVRFVFDKLDMNKEGIITAETVDITTIDSKILAIISEILFALEDEECSLTIQEFYQRLVRENLISSLMDTVVLPEPENEVNDTEREEIQPPRKLTRTQQKPSLQIFTPEEYTPSSRSQTTKNANIMGGLTPKYQKIVEKSFYE